MRSSRTSIRASTSNSPPIRHRLGLARRLYRIPLPRARCPLLTLDGRDFAPHLPGRLLRIAEDIRKAGGRLYLVGGWVRDALRGLDCRDFDIEVYHLHSETLLEILSRYGKPNLVGKAFGVIHLAMKGLHLDFSFPRTENKVGSGHRGFVVETHPDLSFAEAALRRDYTVNAMGMELPGLELCDPYGGEQDLRDGVLRHVGPAFVEDSLRVLRGVQFAARFGLRGAPETVALCRSLSLLDLSRERIGEEFRKWLVKGNSPSMGLEFFVAVGLPGLFHQVSPWQGSWANRGRILDLLAFEAQSLDGGVRMRLMLSGLLVGGLDSTADAKAFLEAWIPENELLKSVPPLLTSALSLAAAAMEGFMPDPPALRRLALGAQGLSLASLLAFALVGVQLGEEEARAWLLRWQEEAQRLQILDQAPSPYLAGHMLLALGLRPGRHLGELIKESFVLQLDGVIGDEAQALEWAKAVVGERGLIST